MRKLIVWTWNGDGNQGAIFLDAIIGFEALEPCDKEPYTAIHLVTGKVVNVIGSIDEWIQGVMEALESEDPIKDMSKNSVKNMVEKIVKANK